MLMLFVALSAFVGTHFAMSHPLRAPMVSALGAQGFQLVYLLVSFVTLGWAAHAFREAPYGQTLWTAGDALWVVSTAIMFAASVLLAGSFVGNPALPQPGAEALAARPAHGVFTITRHPMMWSFALWGLAHVIVAPRPAVILLCAAMAFLALAGAAGQDVKKRTLMGPAWTDWSSRTSYWPFAKGAGWPGTIALVGGTILWLAASWAHPLMGAPMAGVWRWLS
jgi:uncharacterized membrane protein